MNHVVFYRRLAGALVVATGLLGPHVAAAQTLKSVMYFNGSEAMGGLTIGTDGALYGVASESKFGAGAIAGLIYRVTTNASAVNTVYQYGRLGVYDGGGPRGTLAQDASGNLYGVTAYVSIDSTYNVAVGQGTIFKLAPNGTYTRLHTFADATSTDPFRNPDGSGPIASLLLATDGFLYGTTTQGGANGTGTIFKISTNGGGFAVLHQMDAVTSSNSDSRDINNDGSLVQTRLAQASNGDLVGTAASGGVNGTGTIFTLRRDGTGFQVLRAFDASPETISDATDPNYGLPKMNSSGGYPASGLLLASNGLLYGTTTTLGANGYGSIYRIAADGTGFTVLQQLSVAVGGTPIGDLMVASDGTIVGTTSTGGTVSGGTSGAGAGTLFSLTLDGATLTTLYVFGSDGATPSTGVVQTSDGNFYGTTSQGSSYGYGTIFRFGTDLDATPLGNPEASDDGSGAMAWRWLAALALLATATRIARVRAGKRKSVRAIV